MHFISKKTVFCLAALALAGCSEDSTGNCDCKECPTCTDKEDCTCDKNCADDPGKEDPGKEEPGKEDPGKEDPGKEDPGKEDPSDVCADQECTPGETKCSEKQVVICKADENGCGLWGAPENCPDKQYCREQTQKCQYACGDECDPFSVVMIPDTQYYTLAASTFEYTSPETPEAMGAYEMQMKWIADHAKDKNIKMAMHLGDITNNNYDFQWQIASKAHEQLDKAGVPYTVSTGNHDYDDTDSTSRNRTHFLEYFNNERFQGKDWFHGFHNGANSYATFEVGDLKFLVIALEFGPRKDVLCWANDIISSHQDHFVIITSHGILTHKAGQSKTSGYETDASYEGKYCSSSYLPYTAFGSAGQPIFDELARRHSNVILTVSGHVPDSEFRTRDGLNKNTIGEMLVDYQTERHCLTTPCNNNCAHSGGDTGNGWMRLVTFDPMQLDASKNNVTSKSVTSMENAKNGDGSLYFPENPGANGKYPRLSFYCSELLAPENIDSSKERDNHYPYSPDADIHAPEYSINLLDPIEYKYTNGGYDAFMERDVNTTLGGMQDIPKVASNPETGAFVVVWQDDGSVGDDVKNEDGTYTNHHDIEARLFYSGGCAKNAQFTINDSTKGEQSTPDVAMDKKGNFAVAWADDNDLNGYYEIWMRTFDANGIAYNYADKKKYIAVNTVSAGQQLNPAVSTSPDGAVVVVWEDFSDTSDRKTIDQRSQIYARGFNMDGTERFPQFNVSAMADGSIKHHNTLPDVAVANDGSFIVTWERRSEPDSSETDIKTVHPDIIVKTFNKDGSVRTKEAVVNTVARGPQIQPAVAVNKDGNYYVSYSDDEDQNGLYRVKTVGYNKKGEIIKADSFVSPSGQDGVASDLCMDDNGNVAFTWEARAVNEGDARRIVLNSKGEFGPESRVNYQSQGPQKTPATACTADGRQVITWSDDREHSKNENAHHFKTDNLFEIMVRGYDL